MQTESHHCTIKRYPDSKVHVANRGPTWVLSAPCGPHVGPMNFVIRVIIQIEIRCKTRFILSMLLEKLQHPVVANISSVLHWWWHDLETLSAFLILCDGIHRSPVDSRHNGPIIWNFDVFLLLLLMWYQSNSRVANDLRPTTLVYCHCNACEIDCMVGLRHRTRTRNLKIGTISGTTVKPVYNDHLMG